MSFGLLKQFKDHKKGFEHIERASFVAHVIVGSDLGSVLKLMELRKSHPAESIHLISSRVVNKQLLIENYQNGVTLMRSEQAVGELCKGQFNAKASPQRHEPQFYKDGKLHDFNGRAKPMNILDGEEFFLSKGYRLQLGSLFEEENWKNLDEIISQHIDIRHIEGIEKTEAKDLIEKDEWLLTFKDFKKISCENLYLSIPPKRFLSYLKSKEKMTPDLIEVCTSAKIQGALSLTWLMKTELNTDERTLFVPQSMTHEWGHFIIEFESTDEGYFCHGLFLIHEEEPQTEDLATKIKLMKRVLERVFPDFEANIIKEHIRYDEEMFISDVKDTLIEQVSFDYPTLKFVGQMNQMRPQFSQEKFLSRVLIN